jgi:hypothetical protein|tara:strand:- start:82 stop:609 length:528 start_codon:yes stop_codon:yes gene_type:complete
MLLKKIKTKKIFFIVLLPVLITSCLNDDSSSNFTKGRTIAIETFAPIVRDRISFTDTQGNIRLIKPKPNNKLVAVKVRIINESVTYVPLFIDTEAAELGDRGGSRGWNIDPYKSSVSTSSREAELDKFTPLLSGHIELNKGFEVTGWMLFDIERNISPLTLWWRESDDITSDLPK